MIKKTFFIVLATALLFTPYTAEAFVSFRLTLRPNVVGLFSDRGDVGDVVTITGYNFITNFPRPTVWFGNCLVTSHEMLSFSYRKIMVRVPKCIEDYPHYSKLPVRVRSGYAVSHSYRYFTKITDSISESAYRSFRPSLPLSYQRWY